MGHPPWADAPIVAISLFCYHPEHPRASNGRCPMRTGNRVAVGLALMAFTLAGCSDDGASETPSDIPTDATEDGAIAPDNGEGDFSGQSDEMFGKVEIPDDIPLPEEHEVSQTIGNPDDGYTIMLTSPMPYGEVADFYEIELPAAGWESVDRKDPAGADVISIDADRAADDHGMLVQISPDGDGSSVVILTGPPGG